MTSQSSLRPAAQEEVGHWVGSSLLPPTQRFCWSRQTAKAKGLRTPASGLCNKPMGWVGGCGSMVHASPQSEGGRRLSLPIGGLAATRATSMSKRGQRQLLGPVNDSCWPQKRGCPFCPPGC